MFTSKFYSRGVDAPSRSALTIITFQVPTFLALGARGYRIDPGCFGRELAQWLMDKLARNGLEVAPVLTESVFTWGFQFGADCVGYVVELGYMPDRAERAGKWRAAIEVIAGLPKFERALHKSGVETFMATLESSPGITEIEQSSSAAPVQLPSTLWMRQS